MKTFWKIVLVFNVMILSISACGTRRRVNTIEKQNKDLIVKVDSLLKIKNK